MFSFSTRFLYIRIPRDAKYICLETIVYGCSGCSNIFCFIFCLSLIKFHSREDGAIPRRNRGAIERAINH